MDFDIKMWVENKNNQPNKENMEFRVINSSCDFVTTGYVILNKLLRFLSFLICKIVKIIISSAVFVKIHETPYEKCIMQYWCMVRIHPMGAQQEGNRTRKVGSLNSALCLQSRHSTA
jgi:hypothetical protein